VRTYLRWRTDDAATSNAAVTETTTTILSTRLGAHVPVAPIRPRMHPRFELVYGCSTLRGCSAVYNDRLSATTS
jgi:hypothetical protein